ncbi:hypothetical protein [Rummeliibacillus sp. SL167]|uniref:hypothetical protein n=1 Tax=Rummeliibacillus sp. SL167 TaxID=2579792 RepID=UPI0011B6E4E1|nr:hypothetical protein [Rummeliibacillus sp. SL167]
MVNEHSFVFIDENKGEEGTVIKEILIDDLFLEYIFKNISEDENIYNNMPTLTTNLGEGKYGLLEPTDRGFSYCGITVVNYRSMEELKKMFLQWINLLEKINVEYVLVDEYYKKRNPSQEEIKNVEALLDSSFNKNKVLAAVYECLEIVNKFDSPRYILICEGL